MPINIDRNAIHRCTESPQATGSGTNHANIPFNASLFHKCPSVQMLSWLPTRNVEEPKKFDWTFTLGVVGGGGLIESTDGFMFFAPDDGYRPKFRISHKAGDSNWVSQEKHKFYVKSHDGGHYARIEITVIPRYQGKAAYILAWALNPSGSRNLEPRPSDESDYLNPIF